MSSRYSIFRRLTAGHGCGTCRKCWRHFLVGSCSKTPTRCGPYTLIKQIQSPTILRNDEGLHCFIVCYKILCPHAPLSNYSNNAPTATQKVTKTAPKDQPAENSGTLTVAPAPLELLAEGLAPVPDAPPDPDPEAPETDG